MPTAWKLKYGANPRAGGGVEFRVWAPAPRTLALNVDGRVVPMTREGEDFVAFDGAAGAGSNYSLILDGERERPDPVSRCQPLGVHMVSRVIDPDAFPWTDGKWRGLPLEQYIFYELHTGTFTPEGTFEGVIDRIPYLKELGITALELMPVAEFPGGRNWGYDGVDLYAPHWSYGGPVGLKSLVDACHRAGIAVVLDVVYNHVGPEGNYLSEFGPWFTDDYRTPWGSAVNYDGPGSDGVRRFVIENVLYWLTEYHIDALRLDAIHSIFDFSAWHILAELGERFHEQAALLGRRAWLIGESDLNDARVIKPRAAGGWGLDAQWHDEFHHTVASYLTKAERGFLGSFGRLADIGKALTEGFVYDGIYSPWRRRRFGSSSRDLAGRQFVVFLQNHDQIANTHAGQRLAGLVSDSHLRVAIALLVCSPYLPLLFMGDEFAQTEGFRYFTSHGDPDLALAVTEGRQREYAEFHAGAEFFDPQAVETFERSRVAWAEAAGERHRAILRLFRDLIALRKRWPCLSNCRKDLTRVEIDEQAKTLRMERSDPAGSRALLVCNFGPDPVPMAEPDPALRTSPAPAGNLAGESAALFLRE
ncbi:MAG TPA: malto-oligosyltrehalose trehalohydrolase [Bryobacteraceae bacterium]|nr:malto-oligosyltrehalose trehalohydrolase [Bryobacteraceae bacterium]